MDDEEKLQCMEQMLNEVSERIADVIDNVYEFYDALVDDMGTHGDQLYLEKWDPEIDEPLPPGLILRKSCVDTVKAILRDESMVNLEQTMGRIDLFLLINGRITKNKGGN